MSCEPQPAFQPHGQQVQGQALAAHIVRLDGLKGAEDTIQPCGQSVTLPSSGQALRKQNESHSRSATVT